MTSKVNKETQEKDEENVQSYQQKHDILMSLLQSFKIFHIIIKFYLWSYDLLNSTLVSVEN